eukprot:scaffold251700_cov32-Tisochrysis_lutea.AAC.1
MALEAEGVEHDAHGSYESTRWHLLCAPCTSTHVKPGRHKVNMLASHLTSPPCTNDYTVAKEKHGPTLLHTDGEDRRESPTTKQEKVYVIGKHILHRAPVPRRSKE